MARPLSAEKRQAIMAAAIRTIAAEGTGAPTARMAREAGVAEGTLFTYFPTKDALLNELYLVLKSEVTRAILSGFPNAAARRDRLLHVWRSYIAWGVENPERRRALQHLSLSDRLTAATIAEANDPLAPIANLIAESIGMRRPMSLPYAQAAMAALADATIDTVMARPDERDALVEDGGRGLTRFLGKP